MTTIELVQPTQQEPIENEIPTGWHALLKEEFQKKYFQDLKQFLSFEHQRKTKIFPTRTHIFRAFQSVPFDKVKIVILGQDPYHGEGQAIGLSFAVPNQLKRIPPSLKNIFKELASDLAINPEHLATDLSGWTEQGILLLNTVLTVRASEAFSHRNRGWEQFTDQVIKHLNARDEPIVFILWGAPARKKKELITNTQHNIIESAHPSPLSAYGGFFGSKPFSKANEILTRHGIQPIDWARTSID